jgi:voltage-gated potassium channel
VEETFSLRRFGIALIAFVAVLAVGTVGFHFIVDEGWTAAFYRAVVTTTLTGLDTRPETAGGQLFSILLLFAGVAIFLYVAGNIVEIIARGVITGAWSERTRRRKIEELRDHVIICGYGRVGRRIAAEFREAGARYVVVDHSDEALDAARDQGDLYVAGDGTQDRFLREAGLDHASGLVASSDSDATNVSITLSARDARADLLIVARAGDEEAARRLRLAGADRVVQPYSTAGREMATLVLKPQVAAFLDAVSPIGGPDLLFEEIEVTADGSAAGKTIGDLRIRGQTGALIVALRRSNGGFETTPPPDVRLDPGDVMVAVGTPDELRALEELVGSSKAVAG